MKNSITSQLHILTRHNYCGSCILTQYTEHLKYLSDKVEVLESQKTVFFTFLDLI